MVGAPVRVSGGSGGLGAATGEWISGGVAGDAGCAVFRDGRAGLTGDGASCGAWAIWMERWRRRDDDIRVGGEVGDAVACLGVTGIPAQDGRRRGSRVLLASARFCVVVRSLATGLSAGSTPVPRASTSVQACDQQVDHRGTALVGAAGYPVVVTVVVVPVGDVVVVVGGRCRAVVDVVVVERGYPVGMARW